MQRHGIEGVTQCEGDLGARMQHAAMAAMATNPRVLLIGTDCPALTPADLRAKAERLAVPGVGALTVASLVAEVEGRWLAALEDAEGARPAAKRGGRRARDDE